VKKVTRKPIKRSDIAPFERAILLTSRSDIGQIIAYPALAIESKRRMADGLALLGHLYLRLVLFCGIIE